MDLPSFLAGTELCRELPSTALQDLASRLELRAFQPTDVLLQQGEPADALCWIVEGLACLVREIAGADEKILAGLSTGDSFSATAVLADEQQGLTVRALSDGQYGRLTRDGFDAFAALFPEAASMLTNRILIQFRRRRLAIELRLSRVFAELGETVLEDLEAACVLQNLPSGDALFRHGDPGDGLYLILNGRIRVVLPSATGEQVLSELGRGDTVGEMSVLSGESRSATVYAVRDTQLAHLSQRAFETLLARHSADILQPFLRCVIHRLREQNEGKSRPTRTIVSIAVVPLSAGVRAGEFTRTLGQAFAQVGKSLAIDSELVERQLGTPGIAQATVEAPGHLRLTEWLNRLEAEHRVLLYAADETATEWTRRCLRQADLVVLLGDGREAPEASDVWRHVSERSGVRKALVLLHPDRNREPVGAARWLAALPVDRHYHIVSGDAADIARLVRGLTGRSIGLVLGGGFMRGLAHVGVLKALQEAGVPIDAIGGTSMGSVIAAEWLKGWTPEQMVVNTCAGLASAFRDFTVPLTALSAGIKHRESVRQYAQEMQIEDLWKPFFCISANLTRASMVVHETGYVLDAVLSSTRVPGIFPPMERDGDLLVDGGILNNVPVDVMRERCEGGLVIAVDVSPEVDMSSRRKPGDATGMRLAWRYFRGDPRARHTPTMVSVLTRTMELGGQARRHEARNLADLYLRIPLEQFRSTDAKAGPAIAAAGYEHSRAQIADWWQRVARGQRPQPGAGPD